MDDQEFRQLLDYLGLSWKGYRKVRKGVKKRIRRHMRYLDSRDMAAYLLELENNPEARAECDRLMTVSISRFFRDREFWSMLQEKILPDLIKNHPDVIRAWSAGCACGEEVYSLKIVWDRLKIRTADLPELTIMATDINPTHLKRAASGIYTSSSLKEMPDEVRSDYFDMTTDGTLFSVKDALKKDISWSAHPLHSDPPGSDYHLIFLRNNLLTYYQDPLKKVALEKITDRLRPSGFLIVGSHEHLPPDTSGLIPYGNRSYVFRKHGVR